MMNFGLPRRKLTHRSIINRTSNARRTLRANLIETLERRDLLTVAYHNVLQPLDVSNDSAALVTPIDALLVINELNAPRYTDPLTKRLKTSLPEGDAPPYLDVSCDSFATPLDALLVINSINSGVQPTPWVAVGLESQGPGGHVDYSACTPRLVEGDSFLSQLTKQIVIPVEPSAVKVSFRAPEFDRGSDGRIRDAFEVAFLDATGKPLVSSIFVGSDAVFNWTEGLAPLAASGVNAEGFQIQVGLNGIAAGTTATIVVRLINNDGDFSSAVQIDGVDVIPSTLQANINNAPVVGTLPGATRLYADFSLSDYLPATDDSVPNIPGSPQVQLNNLPTILPIGTEISISGSVSSTEGIQSLALTINGQSVDSLDSAGNFFKRVTIASGINELLVEATDSNARTGTAQVRILGATKQQIESDLSQYDNVTDSLSDAYGRTSLDSSENSIIVDFGASNASSSSVDAPLLAIVSAISVPTVRLRGYNGQLATGEKVVDLSSQFNNTLWPGRTTSLPMIAFDNPEEVDFTYDVEYLARRNTAPLFASSPTTESIIGRAYAYRANATDLQGDIVTYRMLQSPQGAAIDPNTGVITWLPQEADIGNAPFVIEANDQRGGRVSQAFVASVTTPPPNRPPVFTSLPIVAGTAFSEYKYLAQAIDADLEAITYELTSGPTGMHIDAFTGAVSWTPESADLGLLRVAIKAVDTSGGNVTQLFDLIVTSPQSNNAPIVISQPNAKYVLPGTINAATSNVEPQFLDLQSPVGNSVDREVTVTIPAIGVQQSTLDTIFILDQNMPVVESATRQGKDWLGDLAIQLNSKAEEAGITNNRFGMVDFGNLEAPATMRRVDDLAGMSYLHSDTIYGPGDILPGDLDNDGDNDFIENNGFDTFVWLNDGTGHFEKGVTLNSISSSSPVIWEPHIVDMNRDGKLDLVAAIRQFGESGNAIGIWIGDGTGGFAKPIQTALPYTSSVQIISLNNDDFPDVVATTNINTFYAFQNNGQGALGLPFTYTYGPEFLPLQNISLRVRVGDFNGDLLDDVVLRGGSNDLNLYKLGSSRILVVALRNRGRLGRIVAMSQLSEHYRMLLGLDDAWRVDSVDLQLEEQMVVIRLEHKGQGLVCPECGGACSQADLAPERTWRHLDTMQFTTEIRARVPRSNCSKCGVKTVALPWAGKHSRFTLMFEAFAIEVLQACSNVKRAAALLRLHWDSVQAIMERAVERGLARRSTEAVKRVGMDEKAFKKGHSYVSILTDIDGRRVLDVAPERTQEAAEKLWETLPESQREQVEAVAMDMWHAYMNAAKAKAPKADIVHDKFHIAAHLNEAVDQVRRRESKQLNSQGIGVLKGTRQLWLFNEENLDDAHLETFDFLKELNLKTAQAWALKEQFQGIWTFRLSGWAKRFFERWHKWVELSDLAPMKKKAKMLKRFLPNILNYFKHFITNATSEGFNSSIQTIKSAAKGFRKFENFRIRILFYCGKLSMQPTLGTH